MSDYNNYNSIVQNEKEQFNQYANHTHGTLMTENEQSPFKSTEEVNLQSFNKFKRALNPTSVQNKGIAIQSSTTNNNRQTFGEIETPMKQQIASLKVQYKNSGQLSSESEDEGVSSRITIKDSNAMISPRCKVTPDQEVHIKNSNVRSFAMNRVVTNQN